MKTIEERAAIVFPYEEGDDWAWANQVGYIRGATEQKWIDIYKACEILRYMFKFKWTDKENDYFRKAMEE